MPKSGIDVELVQAGSADVARLAPLFDAYRQFYRQPSNLEAARRFLFARLSRREAVVFLAVRAGNETGFVLLYPVFSSIELTRQWILNDFYVVPAARKSGVGRALMQRAQEFAQETNASGLMLETAVDNHTAQRLYEGLGWKRDNEFYRYFYRVNG